MTTRRLAALCLVLSMSAMSAVADVPAAATVATTAATDDATADATTAATAAATTAATAAATTASKLVGNWIVDLRPTPNAAPYLRKLVITRVDGTRVEGHFYDGSPLQAGRINTTVGPVPCFAFFTDPGEGAYQTAARLVGPDRLEGMTLSTTRGFLLPWVAVRDAE